MCKWVLREREEAFTINISKGLFLIVGVILSTKFFVSSIFLLIVLFYNVFPLITITFLYGLCVFLSIMDISTLLYVFVCLYE